MGLNPIELGVGYGVVGQGYGVESCRAWAGLWGYRAGLWG